MISKVVGMYQCINVEDYFVGQVRVRPPVQKERCDIEVTSSDC